jgi:phosphodiesterase/alkaline phosphatase D-like protein
MGDRIGSRDLGQLRRKECLEDRQHDHRFVCVCDRAALGGEGAAVECRGAAVVMSWLRASSRLIECLALLAMWRCEALLAGEPVNDIAFGSCLNKTEHPMLDRALTLPMDVFIFLGDNIYADTEDMGVMRAKYDALKESRFFRELRKQAVILATWDDHDFGLNDGGAEYAKRKEAQAEFLRWLDEPADSPRRQREGVYDARIFGPEGKRVQVILLDTRYFRGPLRTVPESEQKLLGGLYLPSTDVTSTMLGETQWRWLGEELKKPAEIRLIASSIQFVSEFSGGEAWANLPHEKERMVKLLASTRANGVLFISGDRHWTELSRMDGPSGYPLFDLTASAMTVPHPRGTPTPNKYRAVPTTYHDVNAGHLHIDWAQADPVLTLKIVDFNGATRIEQKIRLSDLQPRR